MKKSLQLTLFGIASLYFVTVAVNIQVPLYGTYAHNAGYGSGITALAFALYILGVLPVFRAFRDLRGERVSEPTRSGAVLRTSPRRRFRAP